MLTSMNVKKQVLKSMLLFYEKCYINDLCTTIIKLVICTAYYEILISGFLFLQLFLQTKKASKEFGLSKEKVEAKNQI